MDKFLETVKRHANVLIANSTSSLFDHRGSRGLKREELIREFLRPLLPQCYGLATGEIFSTDGGVSRQVDIILYDSVFSNVFLSEGREQLIPCESVFGTIEVKSNLSSKELNKSVENIMSVKGLSREASTMLDILPHTRFGVGAGLTFDRKMMNPYLGYILAYQGIKPRSVVNKLNGFIKDNSNRQLLPDFVFNINDGYIVFRTKRTNNTATVAKQGEDFERYCGLNMSEVEVVSMLFLTLNIQLNQTLLKSRNLNDYWLKIFESSNNQIQ